MKKNLLALGKHVFGDHSYCGSWCRYLQNPLKYKPKHLPYSRYLCDEKLKITLMDLLHKYSSDADKLTHLGSSQANESLNNAISSKAPKTNFFSGSESNDYRVAAAIAQKNIGYGYVTDVSTYTSIHTHTHTHSKIKITTPFLYILLKELLICNVFIMEKYIHSRCVNL